MKRKVFSILIFSITLLLIGCSSKSNLTLNGFYQSNAVNGYHVQISFNKTDHNFVEYIDNREVNKGTYELLKKDNTYKLSSDEQNFEINLKEDNSFDLIINQLNNGKPINMKYISSEPSNFETKFDDTEEYKKLLD
ncbi:hypothetical protein LZ906_016850 (plasmid) [Paraclostridium ghonii]|uniref:hypothetical protein n=1 Tax=Paraclostridium ghonii TaxID=29358 RepID=UPI00202CEEA2|nr:hypothetical protein [Paeniclostridium ghonii]MCM0167255.1 hypothetical protein [Paeniclostridium ghonii]